MMGGFAARAIVGRGWWLATTVLIGLTAAISTRLPAQDAGGGDPVIEDARWTPIPSIGQPSRWRGYSGLGYGLDGGVVGGGAGVTASASLFRDFFPLHYGAAALGAEGYFGQRGGAVDAGGRLLLQSRTLFLHFGMDHNLQHRRTDALLGATFPIQRGGWPVPGGMLRVDWLPWRGHSLIVGGSFPLGQPLIGRTRQREVAIPMPPPPVRVGIPPLAPPLDEAVAALRESKRWIVALHNFFWLAEPTVLDHEAAVAQSRAALLQFHERLDARGTHALPSTYHGELDRYHGELDRALGLSIGSTAGDAAASGRPYAAELRRIALEEIVLPYNRSVGQFKHPDLLGGLIARARARFSAWARVQDGRPDGGTAELLAVADSWLLDFEVLRRQISRDAVDSRMHWIPLALVLRPEEHETHEQIDALVTLAMQRGFEAGNATFYLNAPQFQVELTRTIHQAERYHVLWIHDYSGNNPAGETDLTAFHQTVNGYLRALLSAVRNYDQTGRIPTYILLLDLHMYELRNGRVWMDLLERPLTHRVRLPTPQPAMEAAIATVQDSLRAAVAGSRRLQAEAAALGGDWISGLVRVHVNIINPSDFSFRTPRLLRVPLGGDNLMREHRKIVIRDLSPEWPTEGEVILTGAGVGDHYVSPTWDDRALMMQGPAALEVLDGLRATLARHGLEGESLPAPLRPVPRARDFAARVEEAEAEGATARVMQVHNRTGFAEKEATFVQMLLYDLAPAGTLIYVPDGLWTSYLWMAQLVSASLRGAHVYIVSPARGNAAADAFPQMSRMQELLTRLVMAREIFGEAIAEAGGDLRVGLFAREAPLDDIPALMTELEVRFLEAPFLQEIFPFTDRVREMIARVREEVEPGLPIALPEPRPRRPQLHRKTQLIASRELLETLAVDPGIEDFVGAILANPTEFVVHPTESGPLIAQQRMQPSLHLLSRYREIQAESGLPDPVLYFLVGSMNKNVRSMALDGEAMAVVSGDWALQAYLDFGLFSGGVTWIRTLDDLDELLPPYPLHQRWMARYIQYLL